MLALFSSPLPALEGTELLLLFGPSYCEADKFGCECDCACISRLRARFLAGISSVLRSRCICC